MRRHGAAHVKSEAAGSAAAMSVADRFGIGPGRHRRHAVDLLEALPAIEAGARGLKQLQRGWCSELGLQDVADEDR